MKKRRVYVWSSFLLLFFCLLIYKLADIQLISTESYGREEVNLLEKSVEQRTSQITLTNGRGMFLDRNMKPLNYHQGKDIVIFPFVERLSLPNLVVSALDEFYPNWFQLLKERDKPVYLAELAQKKVDQNLYNLIEGEKISGIIAVERSFYSDQMLASHLLGIVRDNQEEYYKRYEDTQFNKRPQPIGISGLEKAFDPFLLSDNKQKLMYHVDAKGQPLLGINLRYKGKGDPFYPIKIQTTVDLTIQAMAERVVNEHKLKNGGLVLLDVQSRDIVAMVSQPQIDQKHPYKNNSLKNEMLSIHFPGSIFKTVVAAAALEKGQPLLKQKFNCNKNLYGDGTAQRQLGMLNFSESFALSCNYTFATIAKALVGKDSQVIENYAEKLGVLGPVGWSGDVFHFEQFAQLPGEESGKVWGNKYDRNSERAIAQTAIGQKEVKVTPLAVANMMATIASGGRKQEVRAVQKILFNNHTTMFEFAANQEKNQISHKTSIALQQLMEEVVTAGTGKQLQGLPIAGKSGTAETGRKNRYHHWFAGFFPVHNPQYSLVVVDLNQTSGNAKTYPVFKDIVTNILSIDNKQD